MTITLDLSPDEMAALTARANAQGVDVETVLHGLIAQAPPISEPPTLTDRQQALIALIEQWRAEDETDDPEELTRRDADLEEFKANINRWRAEEGRPPAYK